jgi:hypothetical protein
MFQTARRKRKAEKKVAKRKKHPNSGTNPSSL